MENQKVQKLSIWKNRTYMILFGSYSISTFGKFFDMLAVMLMFSYVWKAEPWLISLVPVIYAVPHALFSQFAGVLIDRGRKVNIVLLADLLTAFCTIGLIFINRPWLMLGVLFIRSTISVVHFPAQQALVKQVVQPELIMKAVTLNGTVNHLSKILGPFLGAAIATAFSPKISFVVYAVSLLLSVCMLYTVRHVDAEALGREESVEEPGKESFWQSWRGAWMTLLRSRVLFVSSIFSLIAFSAIQLVDAQFVVLTRELFPANPSVFGWMVSIVGLGAVLILLILNRVKEIKRYGLYLGSAVFLIGIGLLSMGLLKVGSSVWVLLTISLVIGIGTGIFSVVFSYILQVESPAGKVGQMSGMYNSLTGIMLVVAPLIGGLLVQAFGVFDIFKLIGMLTFVTGIAGMAMQRIWWSRKSENNNIEGKSNEQGIG